MDKEFHCHIAGIIARRAGFTDEDFQQTCRQRICIPKIPLLAPVVRVR